MSSNPMSHPYFSFENIEQDFLSNLLLSNNSCPWNLIDAEAAAQSPDLLAETSYEFQDLDPVLSAGAQSFFAKLDTFWQDKLSKSDSLNSALLQDLVHQFGVKIPRSILAEIAQKAHQTLAQSKAEVDAAILCVQGLLPQWSLEDLQVFNRPLAYAMRSPQQGIKPVLHTLQTNHWDELSEFDQARVYLAIAHYALGRIDVSNQEETG